MTRRSPALRPGFTLIELLVVISIIALLIALLLPALGKAKEGAFLAKSLSQKRQLTLGWSAFHSDHKGAMMGASTRGKAAGDWVLSVGSSLSFEQRRAALQDGVLWEYVQTIDVYKTPNDPREGALRSDSLSNYLNGDAGWASGVSEALPVQNIDQVKRPSSTMVFLEEFDPRSADNQGSWVMGMPGRNGTGQWVDWPGNLYLDGNVHSFADGHAVFYRFKGQDTAAIDNFYAQPSTTGGIEDYKYFISVYVPEVKPAAGRPGRG